MTTLRVALIGLGAMGKNHARVLKSLPGVDLIAIFDPAVIVTRSEFPLVSSIEELVALRPDYCVIATPTFTHEELAIKLAQNGINIFIEKPISSTVESALRIAEIVSENKVIGGVGHIERFNAALIEAKRRMKLGELGSVYQISTRRLGPFPSRITDVGVTIDLATHDIDLVKWLTDCNYLSVAAQSARRSNGSNEDLVSCIGKLKNGILINHNVNWLSPLKERKTIITGEKGTYVADTLRSDLVFYENGSILNTQREIAHFQGVTQGQTTIYAFERPEALVTEHQEFIKAVLKEESNYVSLQEAIETLRVAEAIQESSNSGKTILL